MNVDAITLHRRPHDATQTPSQQTNNVVTTSLQRHEVAATLLWRCVITGICPFPAIFVQRMQLLWLPACFPAHQMPSVKLSTRKWKELAANVFLLGLTPLHIWHNYSPPPPPPPTHTHTPSTFPESGSIPLKVTRCLLTLFFLGLITDDTLTH